MVVYLDCSIIDLLSLQFKFPYYNNLNEVPDNCDVVSYTQWTSNLTQLTTAVDTLLPKTKKLLLFLPEPVISEMYATYISSNLNPKLVIFGNASLNFDAHNYHCTPNWFIDKNPYIHSKWAPMVLSQLVPNNIQKPYMFDCLLGKEKPHRNHINKLYQASTNKDKFIFTYFKNNLQNGSWDVPINDRQRTGEKIELLNEPARLSAILPLHIYNQSYYSIVAETTKTNAYSHYTEKTAKTFIAKRPFVMFSGQYFLRNLRNLGFKTFSSVIDESYDNISNDIDRFTSAWQQVERLCELDPVSVINQLTPILEHNYCHLMTTDWVAPLRRYIVREW